MNTQTESLQSAVQDLKGCLLEAMNKSGAERQLQRELCLQKWAEVGDLMEITHDDREAIASAIDKDENLAITLIDRVMDYYRPE